MPPAGLEPAALCLASSIRLSLTARQSWGCWLDYILDVAVPTRIVSEDPTRKCCEGFLRITQSSRLFTSNAEKRFEVPEALRASPHTGSSTQWVPTAFPIKAPTRQMLYPLSYRGTFQKHCMVARSSERENSTGHKKRSPARAISLSRTREIELMQRACVLWFQRTRDGRSAHRQ